ncbi:hypothetical protein PG996_014582 [Apiospora saccharicola]|uniref:DUF1993 domain-containing protein n=1 Tax=Apiospora saccharicola TaxID=335842 RepID=A0ABR1TLG2_9PEZI
MASLYDQSIPVLIKYLQGFSAMIDKSAAYADEKGISHDALLSYRLVPDQRPLTYQVQSCCNTIVWFIDRACRREHTAIADDETTIAQLQARIERTIKYAMSVDAAELSNEPITMLDRFYFVSAQTYLSEFAIPNFHFHLSTGYCILRTQGVPLDAMDYLLNVFKPIPGA